ncbi:MAG: DUF4350 domain-containing protein [Promethearchaeota archaeon]|nr:MAG: DUF4350 domain-containing protein [Candidatus Lokiarchaeota archaeon]
MANYGKIVTPISVLVIAVGGGLAGAGDIEPYIFGPVLGVGILLFFIGLSRWVQGKDRKIMGQIVRPKAAARSSTVWALLFFNLTPFVLINNEGLYNFEFPIPFPISILLDESQTSIDRYYPWMLAVFITFHVIWLACLLLSGKFPKMINILTNLVITLSLSFWMAFGSQFLLWTFFEQKINLPIFSELLQYHNVASITDLLVPLVISAGIIIVALIFLLRALRNLQISFANLTVKGSKRIISLVFLIVVYLLAIAPLGIGIYISLQNYSLIASYVNYIGVVFLAIGIFRAATTLLNSAKEMSKQIEAEGDKSVKGISFGIKSAIFVLIFFLAWAPIVLPLVDQGENSKSYSIYNPDWNGWSNFRLELEDAKYEVRSVQSSISTIAQLNSSKHIILVVGGPNLFYNPASEIPFLLTAFNTNFSMMVCDDHGTAGSLLTASFIASLGATGDIGAATPLTFFPNGILIDNESYWENVNPEFPVIQDFSGHEISSGVSKVVLGHATAFLGGEFLSGFGWEYIGQTSGHYSFIDVDGDKKYDQAKDVYPFPSAISGILGDQGGAMGLMGEIVDQGIPLGGYAQTVFSVKEIALNAPTRDQNGTFSSRMFCATDATWLNNELTSVMAFDNMKMGKQVVDWLACGRSPEDTIVIFDEAHIAPDSPTWNLRRTELSSAASFGAVQGYLNWMSTNPILGIVYPLFALQTFRTWIPKEGNKKKMQLKDLEAYERDKARLKFRTSSFFAQKINWYRQHKKYRQALLQLFRRLERKVNRILGDSGDRTLFTLMKFIQQEHGTYYSKDIYARIEKFFEKMFRLKSGKDTIKEEGEFEYLFLEMAWVSDKI